MNQVLNLENQLGAALRERGLTVCTAESCTGGLIAHRLTNIAGSSEYVVGGVVAYSNYTKSHLLRVREHTLIDYGAVSVQVAVEMATGARQLFGTDYSVSVTGIAGPGGGTAEKPVGLTFIGLAGPDDLLTVERYVWDGDREANKVYSANAALELLLKYVTSD
jgi:PncC family amidohydrolase